MSPENVLSAVSYHEHAAPVGNTCLFENVLDDLVLVVEGAVDIGSAHYFKERGEPEPVEDTHCVYLGLACGDHYPFAAVMKPFQHFGNAVVDAVLEQSLPLIPIPVEILRPDRFLLRHALRLAAFEQDGSQYGFIGGMMIRNKRAMANNHLYYFGEDGKVIRDVDGSKPMVALTYDDGPSIYTNTIIDVFEQYGGKATFFIVGDRVSWNEDPAKR